MCSLPVAIGAVDDNGGVALYSRRGSRLDQAFPEIVGALFGLLPRGTVIDGEIVRWVDGRLDFEAVGVVSSIINGLPANSRRTQPPSR